MQPRQCIQKTGTLSLSYFASLGVFCQTMFHATLSWPISPIVWRRKVVECQSLLQLWRETTRKKQKKAGRCSTFIDLLQLLFLIWPSLCSFLGCLPHSNCKRPDCALSTLGGVMSWFPIWWCKLWEPCGQFCSWNLLMFQELACLNMIQLGSGFLIVFW